MAFAVARPEDILGAYDPNTITMGDQAYPLEVRGAFPEMTGGADTYYEDFTSGLREYVAARHRAAGGDSPARGYEGGRAGADPSVVVLDVDWGTYLLAEGEDGRLYLPDPPAPARGRRDNVGAADTNRAPVVDIGKFIVPKTQ